MCMARIYDVGYVFVRLPRWLWFVLLLAWIGFDSDRKHVDSNKNHWKTLNLVTIFNTHLIFHGLTLVAGFRVNSLYFRWRHYWFSVADFSQIYGSLFSTYSNKFRSQVFYFNAAILSTLVVRSAVNRKRNFPCHTFDNSVYVSLVSRVAMRVCWQWFAHYLTLIGFVLCSLLFTFFLC